MALIGGDSKTSYSYAYDERQDNLNVSNEGDVDGVQISGLKIGAGGDVNLSVLTTDHDALAIAGNLAGRAIDMARDTLHDGLDFAGGVNSDSLNFAGRLTATTLKANDEANARAVAAANSAAAGVATFAGKSLEALSSAYSENNRALVGTFQGSLNTLQEFGRDAFEGLDGAFDNALDVLGGTIAKVTKATTDNIAASADATRSETADSFNRLIKYGAIAGTIIVVAIVISRRG